MTASPAHAILGIASVLIWLTPSVQMKEIEWHGLENGPVKVNQKEIFLGLNPSKSLLQSLGLSSTQQFAIAM